MNSSPDTTRFIPGGREMNEWREEQGDHNK